MKTQKNSRQGSALLLTLLATGVLTLALGSYLYLVSNQYKATARSQQWNSSIPIAEAGIEEAIAHLNRNFNTNSLNNPTRDEKSGGWEWTETDVKMEKTYKFPDESYYVVEIVGPRTEFPEINTRGYARQYGQAGPKAIFASVAGGETATNGPAFIGRKVHAVTKLMPVFDHAIAADGIIDFSGIVETDSFNSLDPNMSTAGQYDPTKRGSNGDVATNDHLEDSLDVGNARIRGRISTGPDSDETTLQIGPNGVVGDTTHVDAGGSGVQEGYYDNDMNVDFEEVDVPFTTGQTATGGVRTENVIETKEQTTTCDCSSYGTVPCCEPNKGPNGEVGTISVVTVPTTTTTQPASGSYVGTVTPQWTSVKNAKTAPSGEFRNLSYRTKNTTSETKPEEGTYVGEVSYNPGSKKYSYNEITGYDYEEIGSYTFAKIKGYQRDFSVFETNSVSVTYKYIFGSGDYVVSELSGKVLVEGNARVYCTGNIAITGGSDGIWIRPGASLDLYAGGQKTDIHGSGIVNEAGSALSFSYYGLPTNTEINITGNGEFIGTVYAPNAAVTLKGGGKGDEDFIGALIAKTVQMVGGFKFHYDEALAAFGPSRGYSVTSWREEKVD